MERVKGIEPSYAVWKTAVLPLNYTRLRFASARPARSETSRRLVEPKLEERRLAREIIPRALALSIRRR